MTVLEAWFTALDNAVTLAGGLHFLQADFAGGDPVYPYAVVHDSGPSSRGYVTLTRDGGDMRMRVNLFGNDRAVTAAKAEEIEQAVRDIRGEYTGFVFDYVNGVTSRTMALSRPGYYRWAIDARIAFWRVA